MSGDVELVEAAREGDLVRVRARIAAGAPIDAAVGPPTEYALTVAAGGGHAHVVAALIAAGARIDVADYAGETALHCAATCRDGVRAIEMLVRAGANVAARANGGWQPLHLAASAEVARVLIAAGADVDARAENPDEPAGETPLHRAATKGREDVVGVLIAAGASVNARTDADETALYLGIPHPAIVERLLGVHADPELAQRRGFTPLHHAAFGGHTDSAKALLAAGARTDVPTGSEIRLRAGIVAPRASTAADLARLAGHAELTSIIEAGTR
jgi:ankyrin repeat protein